MTGGTNAGQGRLKAVIAVTYPEGSVCTITNGDKTHVARDTSGKALFNVTAGDWTVSCTDGQRTTSRDITVESDSTQAVKLNYYTYYYNAGDTCDEVTGGWAKLVESKNGSITFDAEQVTMVQGWASGNTIYTVNPVPLNDINTLYFTMKGDMPSTDTYLKVGIASSEPVASNYNCWIATQTPALSTDEFNVFNVDVTAYNESYYVGICITNSNKNAGTIAVKEVYGSL
jgi:hypothetical protein